MPPVPRDTVMTTPELLELILLQLPMQDLLLCQTTCKAWRTAVTDSVHIQRALYFKTDARGPVTARIIGEGSVELRFGDGKLLEGGMQALQLNELLVAKYPGIEDREFIWEVIRNAPNRVKPPEDEYPGRDAWGEETYSDHDSDITTHSSDFQSNDLGANYAPTGTLFMARMRHHSEPQFTEPNATWRKMLITQPPVTTVRFMDLWRDMQDERYNEHGLTMGDLANIEDDGDSYLDTKWWVGVKHDDSS